MQWWWPSPFNVIRIDPKNLMRLSSFEACLMFVVLQDKVDVFRLPVAYILDQEREQLIKRKPSFVSFIERYTTNYEVELSKRGNIIISVKIIKGNKDILLGYHDGKVKPDRITGLFYKKGDSFFVDDSVTLEIEFVMMDMNSQEYKKFREIDRLYGDIDGYLSFLAKIKVYLILETGLDINSADSLLYNLLEIERSKIEKSV